MRPLRRSGACPKSAASRCCLLPSRTIPNPNPNPNPNPDPNQDDATKRQKMEAQAAQRQVAHHSGAPLAMLRQPEPHAQTTALSVP